MSHAAGEIFETTDPMLRKTRTEYDSLGRTVRVIENYTGESAGRIADRDKTTEFTYNLDGARIKLVLKNAPTLDETTRWEYGTTLADSGIATGHLLRRKVYPDSGDTTDNVEYAYTRAGLLRSKRDQAGTTHVYDYDLRGRQTADRVTALGTGIDGAVRRIELGYDALNRVTDVISHNAVTGGSLVNSVKQSYNGFGQLVSDAQAHTGAVDANTPAVRYEYFGGADNCLARLGTTYPNNRTIDLVYAAGIDTYFARPTQLHDTGTTAGNGIIAEYNYLGTGTVIAARCPQPQIALQYQNPSATGDAGDQYVGFDRFGRIREQRWVKDQVGDIDKFVYAYNRNSLRTERTGLSDNAEAYTYDEINQIKTRAFNTDAQTENWTYDCAGNWGKYTVATPADTRDQARLHNPVNEIRAVNGNANAIKYDRAGNLTQGLATILGCMPNALASTNALLTWDAWNRLVRVRTSTTGFDIRYAYDGLFRRTRQTVTAGNAASLDFYYNKDWKIVEERYVTGGTLRAQYIYGERGRNDLILRDAHLTPGAAAQRHYATSDAMQSITVLTTAAGVVVQRYRYSAFGLPTRLTANFVPATGTDALTGFTPLTSDTLQWQTLFHGETYDLDTSFANYGYRYYLPFLGRWPSRDPIEERGGWNLYLFVHNNTLSFKDFFGKKDSYPLFGGGDLPIGSLLPSTGYQPGTQGPGTITPEAGLSILIQQYGDYLLNDHINSALLTFSKPFGLETDMQCFLKPPPSFSELKYIQVDAGTIWMNNFPNFVGGEGTVSFSKAIYKNVFTQSCCNDGFNGVLTASIGLAYNPMTNDAGGFVLMQLSW